jgi:uncharacterized protein involved in exopolysaccharide biosynthesis/Mrp family chromosome partitioning ATPase
VYYALFRHKWKILFFGVVGMAAAAGVWFFKGQVYRSEAKLLVRYVRDSRAMDVSLGTQGDVRTPDSRGETIISSEIEILTSRDLALEVADLIGPEKILARTGGGTNRHAAAVAILRGLEADVPRKSSVIQVAMNHPDPEMAQVILRTLVQAYLRKHAEVHRAVGVFDEFLTRQTDALRAQLSQTEQELQKLKVAANVTSIEESKRMLAEQASRARQELISAEAELAERKTVLERLRQLAGLNAAVTATNQVERPEEAALDPELERHYRMVLTRLETLRNRELDLLLQFTPESLDVRQVREQIAAAEQTKQELETREPRLPLRIQLSNRSTTVMGSSGARTLAGVAAVGDLNTLEAEVAALEARVKRFRDYLEELRLETVRINDAEQAITELQRRKQREESKYLYFSTSLEQARIDESLGTTSLANINVLQEATAPALNLDKTRKLVLGLFFGGWGFGIGLAMLLEMFLDTRVKRVTDVEEKLKLPLFLTIPDFSRNGHSKVLKAAKQPLLPPPGKTDSKSSPVKAPSPPAPVHPMRLYHEALRDRLIMYFELKEMYHKPKLVGITSTHHGAGVSSIAAGLAESLSETGDGNVLLVDMNPEHGPSVYPFYRGKPGCGLTEEVLEGNGREAAQVQENLYVVSLSYAQGGNRVGVVPRRFASLLPKMKASDYDYIIFDMPPVSQTSVTAKVAGLLDMTFLVVESERSTSEQTRRCTALLEESRAKVTAVLNRYHNYLPRSLQTDV